MDWTTITVTVLANGVISSILLFVFQERIKNSLAKSLYEHQTKFSINHPKALETLETLRNKFALYARSCIRIIAEEDGNQQGDMLKHLVEFHEYFSDNRMYISDALVNETQKIFEESLEVYVNAVEKFGVPEKHTSLVENINELDEQIKTFEKLYKSVADVKI